VVGNDLIGVEGATEQDQYLINRTVVRLCAAEIYTRNECGQHGDTIAAKAKGRQNSFSAASSASPGS
jgi:hypothetical protein